MNCADEMMEGIFRGPAAGDPGLLGRAGLVREIVLRARSEDSLPLLYSGGTMDILWTPWRYAYITGAGDGRKPSRPGVPDELAAWPGDTGCVFCNLIASVDYAIAHGMGRDAAESAGLIVHRGEHCFVCLNRFPYTSGHVLVMPYAHLDRLAMVPTEAAHELMELAQRTERVLEKLYRPQGLNFGLNLGEAAGAGVAGHLHLHGMPRWTGDTNFMTVVGETRVIPESLEITWKRVHEGFAESAG